MPEPGPPRQKRTSAHAGWPPAELLAHFAAAILDGVPLLAPGAEGTAWKAKLNDLLATSRRGEKPVRPAAGGVAGSFKW